MYATEEIAYNNVKTIKGLHSNTLLAYSQLLKNE